MVKHYLYNIEWIGFPKNRGKVPSVYLIGDVYVGATVHTRGRIMHHLNAANRGDHVNRQLGEYLKYRIDNKLPIKVTYLSPFIYQEQYFINKHQPSMNMSSMTYSNKI